MAFLRLHAVPLLLSIIVSKIEIILQPPKGMRQAIITEWPPVKNKDFWVNSSNKSQDTVFLSLSSDLTAYMMMFYLYFIRYWYVPIHQGCDGFLDCSKLILYLLDSHLR